MLATRLGCAVAGTARLPVMSRSYVVTGSGQGIGRAIAERLLTDGSTVVALDRDEAALGWAVGHPTGARVIALVGDAADESVTERAAALAQGAGPLAGWANNAAVFADAWLDAVPAARVSALIMANVNLAVAGSASAIRAFAAAGTTGAIVNVSSHQAQRPVRGALPHATAKAAIEGLTRALAVDYGPRGIRVNAVVLGSIAAGRYEAYLASQQPAAAARAEEHMRALHPLGRVGQPAEVAAAVAWLLSGQASFINGAIVPVDGARSASGPDSEQALSGESAHGRNERGWKAPPFSRSARNPPLVEDKRHAIGCGGIGVAELDEGVHAQRIVWSGQVRDQDRALVHFSGDDSVRRWQFVEVLPMEYRP